MTAERFEKWAVNAWSRVTQQRVTARRVRTYIRQRGRKQLEDELRYWLRMSKTPKP